jgi:hypothetical protein
MNRLALRLFVPAAFASLAALTAGCGASAGGEGAIGSTGSAVSSDEQTAYDFFVGKGLTDFQAAGIVGNLQQESNVDPTIAQFGGGPGRGIAQWSTGGRWDTENDDNVVWYAAQQGESEWSLNLQLSFVWYELETFSGYGLSELRSSTSVSAATIAFQNRFEGCGTCDQSARIADAEAVLSAFGGTSGGSSGGGGSGSSSGGGNSSSGSSSGGSSSGGGTGCYSDTLGKDMPANACVQSKYDSQWYQCDDGAWVDRWTDPAACDGVYPL